MAVAPKRVHKQLERIRSVEMCSWLTMVPERRNDTLLYKEEIRDNLCLRYGMQPICLPDHCNGCGEGFLVDHALKCRKGGLVCIWHNDVRDEAGLCGVLATSKSHVSYEPNIFYGTDVTATVNNTPQ